MKKMKKMKKPTKEELAAAAALYTEDNDFARDEPHIDRTGKTVAISIRLPERQLQILKEFARLDGVGYQTLMKRWLDDRIRDEHARMRTDRTSEDVIVELRRRFNAAMRQLLDLQRRGKKAS
jgi:predicted DNA binding CopG/RHH family protein